MNRLATITRADLLVFVLSRGGIDDTVAELFGYAKQRISVTPEPVVFQPIGASRYVAPAAVGETLHDDIVLPPALAESSNELLMALRVTPQTFERQAFHVGNPISDHELKVPWDCQGPPLKPLTPFKRLAPHLKNCLGVEKPGGRLDERQLSYIAGTGLPFKKLPFRKIVRWATRVNILCDHTPEMFPFTKDVAMLCRQLRRKRGLHGLTITSVSGVHCLHDVAKVSRTAKVLAVSAMGQYVDDSVVQSEWLSLSQRLKKRGSTIHALMPCPRNRWQPSVACAWLASEWDRRSRFNRRSGTRAPRDRARLGESLAQLLALLAPASRIDSELLRETRILCGRIADAGTEWDAWHHSECWRSDNCFGFRPGECFEKLFQNHLELCQTHRALAQEASMAILENHRKYAEAIRNESMLRIFVSNSLNISEQESVHEFLCRVVDRLHVLASSPGSLEGHLCGLPIWFPSMVDRLPARIRGERIFNDCIAQGLALAHIWQDTSSIRIPAGVDANNFGAKYRNAALETHDADKSLEYVVGLKANGLSILPDSEQNELSVPLGRIQTLMNDRLRIQCGGSTNSDYFLRVNGLPNCGISLDTVPSTIRVETSSAIYEFQTVKRPKWADQFWYDQYGIGASFSVNDVRFVLRWIPPGQFLMGSPMDETGRFPNECVPVPTIINHGFWMGETSVTQQQFATVYRAIDVLDFMARFNIPSGSIHESPSTFNGRPSAFSKRSNVQVLDPDCLPVESLTWFSCQIFCLMLSQVVPDAPTFRLPNEAQWEYACRAGNQTPLNDGSHLKTRGGFDPALDQLAWFEANSGRTTHPVKQRSPNRWGLYDMHGNVWEWCDNIQEGAAIENPVPANLSSFVAPPGRFEVNHILRGGSWLRDSGFCRAASRIRGESNDTWGEFGFRLLAEPVDQVTSSSRPSVSHLD